ncbi:hypothetical protein B0H12DRAFT_1267341 [Mycena haematopus]|nr:hypothetical protein B0H12DRAFT_1267341 [Mycena haematopus]
MQPLILGIEINNSERDLCWRLPNTPRPLFLAFYTPTFRFLPIPMVHPRDSVYYLSSFASYIQPLAKSNGVWQNTIIESEFTKNSGADDARRSRVVNHLSTLLSRGRTQNEQSRVVAVAAGSVLLSGMDIFVTSSPTTTPVSSSTISPSSSSAIKPDVSMIEQHALVSMEINSRKRRLLHSRYYSSNRVLQYCGHSSRGTSKTFP